MPGLSDDRGAVAVVTALLMSFVLFAMGAVVIDVGSLYGERRQLQVGADAAALAVAADCGSARACQNSAGGSPGSTAASYANANANDQSAAVNLVCGNGPGLTGCPGQQGPWDCPPIPSGPLASASYVQVETSTRTASGGSLVPPVLARTIPGLQGYGGTNVKACARASWGPPSALNAVLPLTFSYCEWSKYTSNGAVLAPTGPYPVPTPWPTELDVYFHNTTQANLDNCLGPAGSQLPGGFGWLSTTTGCQVATGVNNWYPDSTGRSAPNGCDATMKSYIGKIVDIPVYHNTNGLTGSNGQYFIDGYAPFFLTGYFVNGSDYAASLIDGATKCASGRASDTCIKGFFTHDIVATAGTIGTGPGYGSVVVQMSG